MTADTLTGAEIRNQISALLSMNGEIDGDICLRALKELQDYRARSEPRPGADTEAMEAAQRIAQEVAELPDRTSPDDWPEAMLVTTDELIAIVARALLQQREAIIEEWLDCAMVDALMEGPALKGWNRSALDRLWHKYRALAARKETPNE